MTPKSFPQEIIVMFGVLTRGGLRKTIDQEAEQ